MIHVRYEDDVAIVDLDGEFDRKEIEIKIDSLVAHGYRTIALNVSGQSLAPGDGLGLPAARPIRARSARRLGLETSEHRHDL